MSNFGIIITVKEDKKMENQKGNGIFLGVVAVATLVVAIIGATFAYFSIAVSGGEGDVNVSAYEKTFDVSVSVERIYPTTNNLASSPAKDGIIPLKADLLTNALGNTGKECLDKRGYMVCALYKATFTNNGGTVATFNVEVKTTSNKKGSSANAIPFEDLAFNSLTGTPGSFTPQTTSTKLLATEGNTTEIEGATVTVGADGAEHYFVVYLEEASDDDNQSTQMGASFTGQVVYTTVAGTERLTGRFDLGNN